VSSVFLDFLGVFGFDLGLAELTFVVEAVGVVTLGEVVDEE